MPFARKPTIAELRAVKAGKLTRARSCTGKHAYSLDKALRMAKRQSDASGETISAYSCLFCPHWHIGHDRRMKPCRD